MTFVVLADSSCCDLALNKQNNNVQSGKRLIVSHLVQVNFTYRLGKIIVRVSPALSMILLMYVLDLKIQGSPQSCNFGLWIQHTDASSCTFISESNEFLQDKNKDRDHYTFKLNPQYLKPLFVPNWKCSLSARTSRNHILNLYKLTLYFNLTNEEASTVLCSVAKHTGSGGPRKKCRRKHETQSTS